MTCNTKLSVYNVVNLQDSIGNGLAVFNDIDELFFDAFARTKYLL